MISLWADTRTGYAQCTSVVSVVDTTYFELLDLSLVMLWYSRHSLSPLSLHNLLLPFIYSENHSLAYNSPLTTVHHSHVLPLDSLF